MCKVAWLLPALLAAGGCGEQGRDARRDPFASFESQCDALPARAPEVAIRPVMVVDDNSRPLAELTAMNDGATARHETMGLTRTQVEYATSIRADGLRAGNGQRVCMRPEVRVVAAMAPMTVYVASEVAADACRYEAVRAHELRHVAIHEAFLAEIPARLGRKLAQANVQRLYFASDKEAAQQAMADDVARVVAAFEAEGSGELAARQAALDTPDEYARVAAACGAASVLPAAAGPPGTRGDTGLPVRAPK